VKLYFDAELHSAQLEQRFVGNHDQRLGFLCKMQTQVRAYPCRFAAGDDERGRHLTRDTR
jgi:hypothetical protein